MRRKLFFACFFISSVSYAADNSIPSLSLLETQPFMIEIPPRTLHAIDTLLKESLYQVGTTLETQTRRLLDEKIITLKDAANNTLNRATDKLTSHIYKKGLYTFLCALGGFLGVKTASQGIQNIGEEKVLQGTAKVIIGLVGIITSGFIGSIVLSPESKS